jgi:hypothetical protein
MPPLKTVYKPTERTMFIILTIDVCVQTESYAEYHG